MQSKTEQEGHVVEQLGPGDAVLGGGTLHAVGEAAISQSDSGNSRDVVSHGDGSRAPGRRLRAPGAPSGPRVRHGACAGRRRPGSVTAARAGHRPPPAGRVIDADADESTDAGRLPPWGRGSSRHRRRHPGPPSSHSSRACGVSAEGSLRFRSFCFAALLRLSFSYVRFAVEEPGYFRLLARAEVLKDSRTLYGRGGGRHRGVKAHWLIDLLCMGTTPSGQRDREFGAGYDYGAGRRDLRHRAFHDPGPSAGAVAPRSHPPRAGPPSPPAMRHRSHLRGSP